MYKVKDKVWSPTFGWGVVIDIDSKVASSVPVEVKFEDNWGSENFTKDGRYYKGLPVSLFFQEFKAPEYTLEKPIKPCPFCGGEGKEFIGYKGMVAVDGIRCNHCGAAVLKDVWENRV